VSTSWNDRRSARPRPAQAVALVAAAVLLAGCGGAPEPDPPSAPVAAPSEVAPPAAVPAPLLADDFAGDRLDDSRWATPERGDLIYQGEGGLNFVVTPEDTRDGVEASLVPKPTGPFREIAFTVTVPSFGESGPGGPALSLEQGSGRNHRVFFGPSGGRLEAAALICSSASCAQYDDFDPPSEFVEFARGEVVPIRVVDEGGRLQFLVRDAVVGQSPADDGSPLTGFRFDLYGADGESWHIVVDSLVVSP
jgi:hypothetical protein